MDGPRYDVFLSHRSGDKLAVGELAQLLKRRKIKPWLDVDLIGGDSWLKKIEEVLKSCASMAVCLGAGDIGPWQQLEIEVGLNRRAEEPGFRIIPVLLPGAEQGTDSHLPLWLKSTHAVVFRERLDDKEVLRELTHAIKGDKPDPGPVKGISGKKPPYRGLEAFDVNDAELFFGRQDLTQQLLDKLRSGDRLLAVLGASGSGKSSLVRAGLLAALKKNWIAGSKTWPRAILKPGEKPLERLVDALVKALRVRDPIDLIKKLSKDPRQLHYTVLEALGDAPETRLILFIDQFEEVFTGPDEAQSKALVGNLLHASQAEGGQVVVLLALRIDFFGQCSSDLAAALSNRHVLVVPMTDDDLRSAIEHPAERVGCELEPGLIELLLRDTKGQQGSLPLLQHALSELWKRRQGRRLTVQAYQEIDGVEGALEQQAEGLYLGFTAAEREVCRQVFLGLVQVSEGTAVTRRRFALSDLDEKGREVVRRLTAEKARLLTTDGKENPTVELAHEALIIGWKRFRDWIDEDREDLLQRRRLDEAVSEWNAKGRDASYLLVRGPLVQAEAWAVRHPEEVNESRKKLLDASIAQRDEEGRREIARLEEEHRRELAKRDEERRREFAHARQLRLRSYGLAAGLVLAVIAAGLAFYQWRETLRQKRTLLARSLAQKVQSVFSSEPSLGLLLAAEAVRLSERLGESGAEQEEALRWALSQSRGRALESGRVNGVGTTPDRRFLVTAGMDGTARIWDLAAKDPATSGRFLTKLDEGAVSALALTSDRGWLLTRVTEGARARIFLRDLSSKQGPHELPEEDWLDVGHPFSPDGRWLVTHRGGTVWLRDLKTKVVRPLGIKDLQAAAFSSDSRWLAMVSASGRLEIQDFQSADRASQRVYRLPETQSRTVWLDFTSTRAIRGMYEDGVDWTSNIDWKTPRPDSGRIFLALGVKRDWLRFPAQVRALATAQFGPIGFGSLSSDGRWVVIQSSTEPPRLFVETGGGNISIEPLESRYAFNQALATGGEGRFLLVNRDNGMFFIDLARNVEQPVETPNGCSAMYCSVSPKGSWIACRVAQAEGVVSMIETLLWRRTPSGFAVVSGVDRARFVSAFSFSPNDRWMVSGDSVGNVLFWDLQKIRDVPRELTRHVEGVTALAFSPKGTSLATAGGEGIIRHYDLRGNDLQIAGIKEPKKGQEIAINALTFNPDGEWLAVADEVGRIAFWKDRAEEHPLGQADAIQSLVFSPDGRLLAGLSGSGAARLWRLKEDRSAVEPVLLPQSAPAQALTFSSDGHLITASEGGIVRRWETSLDKLLKIACQTVGRNLTRKEWETHLPGEPYNPREPCPNLPPES